MADCTEPTSHYSLTTIHRNHEAPPLPPCQPSEADLTSVYLHSLRGWFDLKPCKPIGDVSLYVLMIAWSRVSTGSSNRNSTGSAVRNTHESARPQPPPFLLGSLTEATQPVWKKQRQDSCHLPLIGGRWSIAGYLILSFSQWKSRGPAVNVCLLPWFPIKQLPPPWKRNTLQRPAEKEKC